LLQQMATWEFVSASVERTQAVGERLGRWLEPGDVVALFGELGSGKTTLIQGIARGLGRDPDTVKSPTFVLVREYPGQVPLVHADGYRLDGALQAAWLDVDLLFSARKITVIEWAERFAELLPADYLAARLAYVSANRRRLKFEPHGERAEALLGRLRASGDPRATATPAAPAASSGAAAEDPPSAEPSSDQRCSTTASSGVSDEAATE
jgi:tRNA threonylcarbamoyladenosine biosynthesis protein TsaE